MRTRYLSLEATILRSREQNEADAWVTMLAPVAGLISGVAKNGLRSQRRFMGALVPVTGARVLLARRSGVWYLEEAVVDEPYRAIKCEAVRYALACYALEQILSTHPHGAEASSSYPLLTELLEHLQTPDADLPLTRLSWDLRLMESLGLAPHLADCTVCGMELDGPSHVFHGPSGGLLCPTHAVSQASARAITRPAMELVEVLLASGFPALGAVPEAGPKVRTEARSVIDAHIQWHMPAELRTRKVLEQLSRLNPRRARS